MTRLSFNPLETCDVAEQMEYASYDVIKEALARSGKTAAQVSHEMTKITGKELVSSGALECIQQDQNISFGYNIDPWPSIADVPFCLATGDWSLLRFRVKLARLCKQSATGKSAIFYEPSPVFREEIIERVVNKHGYSRTYVDQVLCGWAPGPAIQKAYREELRLAGIELQQEASIAAKEEKRAARKTARVAAKQSPAAEVSA